MTDESEREARASRQREAVAGFISEIVKDDLGVAIVWSNQVSVWKYKMTADDIVDMVIIGNKYDMVGTPEVGKHPSRNYGDSPEIVVVFRHGEV